MLRSRYWRTPALQPSMPFIDKTKPGKPRKLKTIWTSDGYILFWTAPKGERWDNKATQYVVYRFGRNEEINYDDASKIVAITNKLYYKLPYNQGNEKYTYAVTALNRLHNESKAAKKKIKL
jgi:hypothetical protein